MPLPLKTRDPEQYDNIHRAVDAARNKARLDDTTKDLGTTALTTADVLSSLDDDVAAARHEGTLPGNHQLDRITNPDTRASLKTSLEATEKLFARIDLPTPDLATLKDQHGRLANLPRLASVFEQMQAEDKEPMFVLAPVMTKDEAIALFDSMTPERDGQGNITRNPNGMPASNPLWRRDEDSGFYTNTNISHAVWNQLHDVTASPLTNPDGTESPVYTDGNGRHWSLRVIQGTSTPDDTRGIGHTPQPHGQPSISEYLTMQATRLQSGDEPVDSRGYTSWLHGTNWRNAPRGYWNCVLGRVEVGWHDVTSVGVNGRISEG